MEKLTILLLLCAANYSLCAQFSNNIHVDQFGYLNSAEKVAVISNPQLGNNSSDSYTPGETLEVRDAASDETVFTGTPSIWNDEATHQQSGDKGWWFDFSSLTDDGSYYVYDPSTQEQSATFEISENPYSEVLIAAGRMFFYNRCNFSKASPFADANWNDAPAFGNPGQDTECRNIATPEDASSARELSGGWFDAGDYNKYTTFAVSPIHNLLWAYLENPQAFGDNWNIPESGNGIPDILDEVKYELDWLMKMNDPNTGETLLKMGSQNYSQNTQTPPSVNTDPRYYIGNCSSAAVSLSAMFSFAATVFDDFPQFESYAMELQNRAVTSYDYVLDYIETNGYDENCDVGQVIAGDADREEQDQVEELIVASVYLFELTGNANYEQYVLENMAGTEQIGSAYWAGYRVPLNDALLHYSTMQGVDPTSAQTITSALTDAASNNWESFYGFDEGDLYRASMPDWAHHWGSNMPKSQFATLNTSIVNYNLFSDDADFSRKAAEQLHYFHGVNPLGLVYLSNMYAQGGDRCVDELYHEWFKHDSDYDNLLEDPYGPAPGYLVGGPNKDYSGVLAPPAGEPILKCYAQFNDVSTVSWEITEPAIYYQAAYVRHLANYVDNSSPIASIDKGLEKNFLKVFPNPAKNVFSLEANFAPYSIELLDVEGVMVYSAKSSSKNHSIHLEHLNPGTYLVRIIDPSNGNLLVRKIIKQ